MPKKKNALTIEQHKENGMNLTRARNALIKSKVIGWGFTPTDRKPFYKGINTAIDAIDRLRDDGHLNYYNHATEEEFLEHGRVYHGRVRRNSE